MAEQPQNNYFLISLAIVIAGIIISSVIYWQNNLTTQKCDVEEKNYLADFPLPDENDHIKGNLSAEVIVIEYSDTECPYCKVAHEAFKEITTYYSADNLAWVYRHSPFEEIHTRARKESEAAECAAEQGKEKFWPFIDEIFTRTNSNDTLAVEELSKIATDQNLNMTQWNSCMNNHNYLAKVDAQAKGGLSIGVTGTPYFFIIPKTPFNQHDIEALTRYGVSVTPDGRYATIAGSNAQAMQTTISLVVRKAAIK